MILHYDTKEYVRRIVIKWLPVVSYDGEARGCRIKSFRLGER